MKNFAVIDNNVVINIIVADTLEIAEETTSLTCVEITDGLNVHINDNYVDGVFVRPNANPPSES